MPLPFVRVVDEGGDLSQVLFVIDDNRFGFIDLHGVEDGIEEGQPVDGRCQGLEGRRTAWSDWAASLQSPGPRGFLLKKVSLCLPSAPRPPTQQRAGGRLTVPRADVRHSWLMSQRCSLWNCKAPNTKL